MENKNNQVKIILLYIKNILYNIIYNSVFIYN